jgi:hypothetical protein
VNSKERRVDPQVVVGLLVDRHGFPLEIGCFEGNKAEKATIIPIVEGVPGPAQPRGHGRGRRRRDAVRGQPESELDEAGLRFIVGSRVTKAPIDLASHFRWHGDAFTDGQVIDTLTPRTPAATPDQRPAVRAEPVWEPGEHDGSWRAVWAYSAKRAPSATPRR